MGVRTRVAANDDGRFGEPVPLYPTEERIIREIFGQDAPRDLISSWDGIARVLERDGLPPRDPLFGNRRFWPSVQAWLRRRNGLTSPLGDSGFAPDGEENWT